MTLTHTPELCKVFYDRSAREYSVRNGSLIATFPSGPANKTLALWTALEHDAPDIAGAARELVAAGADEQRSIKAARLVIEGKISLDKHEHGYTRATATASAGNVSPVTGLPTYSITHNIVWRCDCADYVYNREDGHRHHECKHILATEILVTQRNDFDAAAARKQQDKLERRALTVQEQRRQVRASLGHALRPDAINTSAAGAGRAQFGRYAR